jgi:manganese/iron transport system substrate-binding protein
LRDDDLPGRPGDPAHSWLGLMTSDFVTMVANLGGDASGLQALPGADGTPAPARYPQ